MSNNKAPTGVYPIFLDIEVLKQYPEPWMVASLQSRDPPKTMKRDDTIARWRKKMGAEAAETLRDQSSLEPLYGGTIFCIGLAAAGGPVKLAGADPPDEAGERIILDRMQSWLNRVDPAGHRPIVTFNGNGYDLPFIRTRAIRHGLFDLAHRCHSMSAYSNDRHIDLMRIWQGARGRDAKGRLTEVAQYLGITVKDNVKGSEVQQLFESGDRQSIAEHCIEDVRLTREIYWWFRAAGWIHGTDEIPSRVVAQPRTVGLPPPSTTAQGHGDVGVVTHDEPPEEAVVEGGDSSPAVDPMQRIKAECIATAYAFGIDLNALREQLELPAFEKMSLDESTDLLVAINEHGSEFAGPPSAQTVYLPPEPGDEVTDG